MNRANRRRIAVFAAALVTCTTVGASAAHAERLAFSDRRGDLWSVDLEELLSEDVQSVKDIPFEAEPSVTNGDIRRTVITHRRKNVVVRVDFVDLRRAGEFRGDFLMFRTDTGARRMVMLFAGLGLWRGEMAVVRPRAVAPVECDHSHRIDYAENRVEVRLSRECLGNPRWIQMRAESGWARLQKNRVYVDNAHNRSPVNFQFTQRLYAG